MKLAPFRTALRTELQALDLRLAGLTQPEPDGHGDVADRQAAQVAHDTAVEDRARLLARRALCIAALIRIEERTWGDCLDCTEPIGAARLQADPAAARCLSCQATAERETRGGLLDVRPPDEEYTE